MIDSSDDTRGAGAVLKDFFARPLRLVLGDRQLSFATVADFALDRLPDTDALGWIDIATDEFYTDDGSHLARLYTRYRNDPATAGPVDRGGRPV